MLQRLFPGAGGLDGDAQLAEQGFLADVFGEPSRPKSVVELLFRLPAGHAR
jgi:hypothetical protein